MSQKQPLSQARLTPANRGLPAGAGLRPDVLHRRGRAVARGQSAVGPRAVPLVARRARRQAGAGFERPRHHPRLRHQHRARGRHGVRLRRRQSGDLRRQVGVRLAPAARAQRRHHRRHLRRPISAGQSGTAGGTPRHAPLGASARLPRGLSRRHRGAVSVRDRYQPHHLLWRHLGARHDGGADRARPRAPARGHRSATGSCTPMCARASVRSAWISATGLAWPTRSCSSCCAPWRRASRRLWPRAALARQAGISLRQLERLFHRHIGHGIHAHYRWLRLERARQLLRETTLPVLDVALATGFTSSSQFARAYGQRLRRAAEPHAFEPLKVSVVELRRIVVVSAIMEARWRPRDCLPKR